MQVFQGEEATARKLEIDDQCQELLTAWLSERVVAPPEYREVEAALERLCEAVKKECDKWADRHAPPAVNAAARMPER